MDIGNLCQHTCTVYGPPVNAVDASGGTNQTWPNVRAANVACNIRGMSGSEQLIFAQRNIEVTHVIYLLNGSAQSGDKVIDSLGANYLLNSIQIQQGMGNIDTFYFWIGRELLPGS